MYNMYNIIYYNNFIPVILLIKQDRYVSICEILYTV